MENQNIHNGNIERVYAMLGKKLPIKKTKVIAIGLAVSLVAGVGIALVDEVAYAYHAIQQRNIRIEMADIHEKAESSRIYINSLKAEYKALEAKLDDQLDDQSSRNSGQLTPDELDRLAVAVSWAETSNCSKGAARTRNNCFGIIKNGVFEYYDTMEDSFTDFKKIWAKYYRTFPDLRMAKIYTGNDSAEQWLSIVKQYYFNF